MTAPMNVLLRRGGGLISVEVHAEKPWTDYATKKPESYIAGFGGDNSRAKAEAYAKAKGWSLLPSPGFAVA